ncbi:MAG TPA: hypothetical protein VGN57_13395 [Pirellulaceae bacterium]|jgi:hypothetical protein|nr:hypothetical protein [Pirellulaceae bacterium]
MPTFLVGILYHEPIWRRLWLEGAIEDCESSTGLFVEASDAAEAIAWGERVGAELLRCVNRDPALEWKALGYRCWIVADPSSSEWNHCLGFFQRVAAGEMPSLDAMTAAAYDRWLTTLQPPESRGSLLRPFRRAAEDFRRKPFSAE